MRLKPLHWQKVLPSSGSVWAALNEKAQGGSSRTKKRGGGGGGGGGGGELSGAQLRALQRLFAHRGAKSLLKNAANAARFVGRAAALQRKRPELISTQRAQNIAICLTKVTALPYDAMAAAVRQLNANTALGWEDAAALRAIAPTDDESLAVRGLSFFTTTVSQ